MTQGRTQATVPKLRVFIASPSDVSKERSMLIDALRCLGERPSFHGRVLLEAVAWDDRRGPSPIVMTEEAQETISRYKGRPSQCDLAVVILWRQIGTPTTMDGKRYDSGTLWELHDALQAGTEVWLYLRTSGPARGASPAASEVLSRVRKVLDNTGRRSFEPSINTYASPQLFREKVERQLEAWLLSRLQARSAPTGSPEHLLLADHFYPALRNLVRTADDLCTGSDHYLSRAPATSAVLCEQVTDLRTMIEAYNKAWDRIQLGVSSFQELMQRHAVRDDHYLHMLASTAWTHALSAFPHGFELPRVSPRRPTSEQFEQQRLRWRGFRTTLGAAISRIRADLKALELALLERAQEMPSRSERHGAATEEARNLLDAYHASAHAFAAAILQFSRIRLGSTLQFRDAAWSMAPSIERMNQSYISLEERSLSVRLTLLCGTPRETTPLLARQIEKAEDYQWHEVRPRLNDLLVYVILGIHHELDERSLDAIRAQQAKEWLTLAKVLESASFMRGCLES